MTVSQSEPYLAGMFAELRCSINLDNSVDTLTDIEVTWQKDGVEVNNTARVQKLSPRFAGGSRYDALLRYNTLSSSADSGNYLCTSTVYPTENRDYITNITGMASFPFSVAGIFSIAII